MFSPPDYSNTESFLKPRLGPWSVFIWLHRKPILDSIVKAVPFMKGRLLDVGCGNKPYRSLFQTDEYIGIDISTSLHNQSCFDKTFDGLHIPFPDECFDSVLCTEVLEHAVDPSKLMSEIIRVLKPGGHAFITVPMFINHHETPFDFRRYTYYGVKQLVQDPKAKVVFIDHRGGHWHVAIAAFYLAFAQVISRRPLSDFFYYAIFPFMWIVLKIAKNRKTENQVISNGWQLLLTK